jgi:galactoside O-acetyltransferase
MSLSKKNQRVIGKIVQKIRIKIVQFLNTFNGHLSGKPILMQPLQIVGSGNISFGKNVLIGYYPAPRYYEGLCYLEARAKNSIISFGDNTSINNNLIIICAATSVSIGNNVFIGHDVEILDSDLHSLDPILRNKSGEFLSTPVNVGNNVFIGNNVKILKGVEIGDNSTVAHSSIVTKSFPENVIIGGNPAKIISYINKQVS